MYCPHCGKQIADGSYICPYCNKTVQVPQQQPYQQYQQPFQQPFQQQPYQPYQPYQQQYNVPNSAPRARKNFCAVIALTFVIVAAILVAAGKALPYIDLNFYFELYDLFRVFKIVTHVLMWSGLALSVVGIILGFTNIRGQKSSAITALVLDIIVIILFFVLKPFPTITELFSY